MSHRPDRKPADDEVEDEEEEDLDLSQLQSLAK